MKEVLRDKLENFSNALGKLEEAVKESGYSLCLDGTIKRFEFTFEMSWKAMKKFLLYEGIECASVRDCVKKAYQTGYIKDEEIWLNILKDRNSSSHIYDENAAENIYKRIRQIHCAEFKNLKDKFKEKLQGIEK